MRVEGPRAAAVALAASLAAGCGAPVPTQPDETGGCRRYPTELEENGVPFTCTLRTVVSGVDFECQSGTTLTRVTNYAGVHDFVAEAETPNLWRRRRWSSRSGGPLLVSSGETVLTYTYGDGGRVVRRESGPGEHVVFSDWDGQGRPRRGVVTFGARPVEEVTIAYDDAARAAVWSNGEEHRLDARGNPLLDRIPFGAIVMDRSYVVRATAKVCR